MRSTLCHFLMIDVFERDKMMRDIWFNIIFVYYEALIALELIEPRILGNHFLNKQIFFEFLVIFCCHCRKRYNNYDDLQLMYLWYKTNKNDAKVIHHFTFCKILLSKQFLCCYNLKWMSWEKMKIILHMILNLKD